MFRLVTPRLVGRLSAIATLRNAGKGKPAMANQKNREVRLKSRPVGMPSAANFELAETDVPTPAAGQVLVRNVYMSVDPYMRGRMVDRQTYVPPFQLGQVLQGGASGQVVVS